MALTDSLHPGSSFGPGGLVLFTGWNVVVTIGTCGVPMGCFDEGCTFKVRDAISALLTFLVIYCASLLWGSCSHRSILLRLFFIFSVSLFGSAARSQTFSHDDGVDSSVSQLLEPPIHQQIENIQRRLSFLAAPSPAPTSVLRGEVNSVLGSLDTFGSVVDVSRNQALGYPLRNSTTFNYDTKLYLDTSFSGSDLLHLRLRSANFQPSAFWFSDPTQLARLQVGWESEPCATGSPGCRRNSIVLNRAYYQFPLSTSLRATVGARVLQTDILPVFPSVYTDAKILQLFQFAGAQGAYSRRLGPGFGLAWQPRSSLQGFSIGLASIQAQGDSGTSDEGGLFNASSGQANTLQLAFTRPYWNLTLTYTANGSPVRLRGTPLANSLSRDSNGGFVSSWSLAGYWQPLVSGLMPSLSAGYGLDQLLFANLSSPFLSAAQTRSWMIGLVWRNVLSRGSSLGFALGAPNHISSLHGSGISDVHDSLLAMEAYYRLRLSDHVQVIPAIFWITRPRGAMTATTSVVEALEQPDLNNRSSLGILGGLVQMVLRY